MLQQVEARLLKYAAEAEVDQQRCEKVLSQGAGRLVSTVQQLLPHASYTLQQVSHLSLLATTHPHVFLILICSAGFFSALPAQGHA